MAITEEMAGSQKKLDEAMSSHSEKLDTVVSSVKDMQKLLEGRAPDSVQDLSAVLGKISAVSEQVRNAI